MNRVLRLQLLALLMFGCGGAGLGDAVSLEQEGRVQRASPDGNRSMYGTPPLYYYGGPMMPQVKAVAVFWGPSVNFQSQLPPFLSTITSSNYVGWLGSEYNSPQQSISRGSLIASYQVPENPTSNRLSHTLIHDEIVGLVNKGVLPKPDANTLYILFFPPNVCYSDDGATCWNSYAYHSYFDDGKYGRILYATIQDMQSFGNHLLPGMRTYFDLTTVFTAHELIESITDPQPTTGSVPQTGIQAWNTRDAWEIADLCNGQPYIFGNTNYEVQQLWSNARNLCYSPPQ